MADIKNFMSVLYRSIFPEKAAQSQPIEVAPAPSGGILNSSGINRTYQHYGPGKYMTQALNAYCTEMGVQCTVCMDPQDFQQLYYFKNVGDRLVQIQWENEVRYIDPGESVTLKARGYSSYERLPRITALNRGVDL